MVCANLVNCKSSKILFDSKKQKQYQALVKTTLLCYFSLHPLNIFWLRLIESAINHHRHGGQGFQTEDTVADLWEKKLFLEMSNKIFIKCLT